MSHWICLLPNVYITEKCSRQKKRVDEGKDQALLSIRKKLFKFAPLPVVFDGLSFNEVDDILTDVGGMIGNPLQVAAN